MEETLPLIPEGVKRVINDLFDKLVDGLCWLADRARAEKVSRAIRELRSDAPLLKAFDVALQRGARQFCDNYGELDPDVVEVLRHNSRFWERFWKERRLSEALRKLVLEPSSYLPEEDRAVKQHFADALPGLAPHRIEQASEFFRQYIADNLPPHFLPPASAAGQPRPTASIPSVRTNLPSPEYERFIDREDETVLIKRILRPYPHEWRSVISIHGAGGIGKTALAQEVARYYLYNWAVIPPEERFDAIIYASAKETKLAANGEVWLPDPLRGLDDMYHRIATVLEHEAINMAKPGERAAVVAAALKRQRTLLVIDNLETLQEIDAVRGFLEDLPVPTKAIVTTRHKIDVAQAIYLRELSEEDTLRLIRDECRKRGVSLTEEQEEKLCSRSGGVPLSVVWSVGRMAMDYPVEKVLKELADPRKRLLQFCFERSVDIIRGKGAHKLLLTLAVFADGADGEALGFVAGLDEDTVSRDEGLVDLQTLSLVHSVRGRYSMLESTRSFIFGEFEADPDFSQQARLRFVQYYAQLVCNKLGIEYWSGLDTWHHFELVKTEIQNILAAADMAAQLEMWQEVRDVAIGIVHQLFRMGLWEERVRTLRAAITAAQRLDLKEDEALMRLDGLAWIYLARGDLVRAREEVGIGQSIGKAIGNEDLMALADRCLAMIYIQEEAYEPAEETLLRGLQRSASPRVRCRLLLTMGDLKLLQRDNTRAKQCYDRAIGICRSHEEMTGLAGGHVGLGRVYLRMDRPDLARPQFYEAIGKTDDTRDIDIRARARLGLGLVEEAEGNLPDARELLQSSLESFIRCGMKEEESQAREALKRIS